MNWNEYFRSIAYTVAQKSKDPNTKVGAVIVGQENQIISTGYNGFPRGVKDHDERWERPTKYNYVVHAEANAIYNAARHGIALKGCSIHVYGTPEIGPCSKCAQAIVQVGLLDIYSDNPFNSPKQWQEEMWLARRFFEEGGVKHHYDRQGTE